VLSPSRFSIIILVGALLVAVLGARPYASSWNDGSRLASVETLVDRHTWVIDDSIFVKVPLRDELNPYSLELPSAGGTMDKMLIGGHFYSDKPPVLALYLAGVYWVAQKLTGLTAADDPHVFVYMLTVMSAGLAYVVGVLCIWFLALRIGLSANTAFLITLSFGLATIAPVYSREVNNHIMQLGVVAGIFLLVNSKQKYTAVLGLLVGMAYTLDLGIGPVLVLSTLIYVCIKWSNLTSPAVCALGMLPFMALHHWLNYRIGGTFGPANANTQFFDYPGSAFSAENMTGVWAHDSVWGVIQYGAGLLLGPHGFLLYNLPLLLIPLGAASAWRAFPDQRAELVFATLLGGGSWVLYAIGSNNYSGLASSIRWFVPLLVPAYFVLMLTLKARPGLLEQFKILTQFGVILTAVLFWVGPWRNPSLLVFWVIVTLSLVALVWSLRHNPKTAALGAPASS
jgi:hypothetical protein